MTPQEICDEYEGDCHPHTLDQRVQHFKGAFYRIIVEATESRGPNEGKSTIVYQSEETKKFYTCPSDMFWDEVDREEWKGPRYWCVDSQGFPVGD